MKNHKKQRVFNLRLIGTRSIDGSLFEIEKGPNFKVLKGPDGVDTICDAGYIDSGHKPKTSMALRLNF